MINNQSRLQQEIPMALGGPMSLPIRPAVPSSTQGPTTVALNNYADAVNLAHMQNIATQNNYLNNTPVPPVTLIDTKGRSLSNFPEFQVPDEDYIGDQHKQMVEHLKSHLVSHPNRRLAICGQPGSGKSEMACRVAKLLGTENQVLHTFFVSASTEWTLKKNYEDIFDLMFVRNNQIGFDELFRRVRSWLDEPKNGAWLMIMDDFTEPPKEDGGPGEALTHRLISTRSHGALIVTTGNQATALKLMGGIGALCFEVQPLLKEDACELLRTRLPRDSWPDTIECSRHLSNLVEVLDNNPSAIVLAAAHITLRRKFGETVSTYLTSVKQTCNLVKSSPVSGFVRDPMVAWEEAFIRIQDASPEAADLLALMACFNRTSIPFSLLNIYIPDKHKLRVYIGTLADYMLIITLDRGNNYTMPSLVQLAAHKWLHRKGLRLGWQCRALSLLFQAYEKAATDSKDSPTRAYQSQLQLLPHLDILLWYCKHINKLSLPCPELLSPELVPALVCFANLYKGEGRPKAAKILLYRVVRFYKMEDTWKVLALTTMAELISDYPSSPELANRAAELKKARDILKQARTIARDLHSRDAEIDILSSLALNYAKDSRFKLAEKHQLEVVGFRERQYPPGSEGIKREVAEARLRLSRVYYLMGKDLRRKEACCLDLERARVQQEKLLVEIEPTSKTDIDWMAKSCEVQAALARTCYAQGAPERALQLAKKAYEGRLIVFGRYDLATLGVKQDLVFCLSEMGREEEAKRLFEEARRELEDKFGVGHYEVRNCEERRRRMLAAKAGG